MNLNFSVLINKLHIVSCKSTGNIFVLFCFVFRGRVSLCNPDCPGTHSVDKAGLELRNPPASARPAKSLHLKRLKFLGCGGTRL